MKREKVISFSRRFIFVITFFWKSNPAHISQQKKSSIKKDITKILSKIGPNMAYNDAIMSWDIFRFFSHKNSVNSEKRCLKNMFCWVLFFKMGGHCSRVLAKIYGEFMFLSKNRPKIVCNRVKPNIWSSHFCISSPILFANKDLLVYIYLRDFIEYLVFVKKSIKNLLI